MESVLSQHEVNALLNAVNMGAIEEVVEEESRDGIRQYDLTSNDRIIRGRMPTLDILNQRLARLMRIALFNLVRKTVEVSHAATQLMKYSEFIASVAVPACLNVFRLPPLRNSCLVAVDSDLMFGMVDFVFGGKGSWYRVEGREYSGIEMRLIREIISMVLECLGQAWEPVIAIKPEYVRTEVNPQFAAIAAPTDASIHVIFDVELEAAAKGQISLLIPYQVIEPIRRLLSSALQTERGREDNEWRSYIRNVLTEEIAVDFRAILGKGTITARDLVNLKVGDSIRLDADAQKPLECRVEEVPKAFGRPVVSRGRLAVHLVTGLDEEAPRLENKIETEGPDGNKRSEELNVRRLAVAR